MTRLWLLALVLLPLFSVAADNADAWQALREGRALILMRHATAPGTGDPANFRLGQCETQRNLNAQGRAEARRWGELLARQGIEQPRLLSSRWCRALDTASNMQRGPVQPFAALDSFFGKPEDGAEQTAELIRSVNQLPAGAPLVLVSHQVNITALTGIFPASGEGLILALPLRPRAEPLARIPAP
ncbi:histidine phosphatase family protein [Ectopseudomonas chengduensis]|jgi:phosphohistidine phosphatase SixA|uniref:Phosphohistidine phosphatase SixA n=2 Tax=Pseudomonadaceae TaxID=135621 RepID=A0A1H2LKT1_9PSED|nr:MULTISPECIES: histidine phosphatase family protein [Pseudomonas]KJU78405.1 fructose-2,6-bisphosphatase [Pseudomonas oleovorans]KQO31070.1 fructose-2,6-bisphosphatase [Pseudomonas sp. Leaf83]MBG0847082.1 histidine phosphatase family protein [Pseudomonas chengduensis]MBP3061828.1 histidine phosphatase family protein [Pseudomonas chengduensis]MDH0957719.1 histidine phosphatase family protein [Pseudomonas chengduensis]